MAGKLNFPARQSTPIVVAEHLRALPVVVDRFEGERECAKDGAQGISRKSESSPRRASEPAVRRAQDLFSLNARNSGRRDRDRVLVVPMLRAFVDQDRASQSSNRNPGVSTGDASSANRNGDEKGQNQTREGRSAR